MALLKSATRKLLVLAGLLAGRANALEVGLVKPLAGQHFLPRSQYDGGHGGHWNENYMDSIGVYIDEPYGFGASVVYVNRNSFYDPSVFTCVQWVPTVHRTGLYFTKVGFGAGLATGYPKMGFEIGRFLPVGGMQLETGYDTFAFTLQVIPVKFGVVIVGLKYGFKIFE
jgi:hypothetical protein